MSHQAHHQRHHKVAHQVYRPIPVGEGASSARVSACWSCFGRLHCGRCSFCSKLKATSLSSTSLSSTSLSLRCTSPLLVRAVVPNTSLPLASASALVTPTVSRCCWCSARPSHKQQRTGSRLLDKQQSKPSSRSSARSARPQSAPLGGRTARRDRKLPLGVGAARDENKYLWDLHRYRLDLFHEVGKKKCPWQNGQWLGGVDGWQQ